MFVGNVFGSHKQKMICPQHVPKDVCTTLNKTVVIFAPLIKFAMYWQVTLKMSSIEFRESRFSGFGVDVYIL